MFKLISVNFDLEPMELLVLINLEKSIFLARLYPGSLPGPAQLHRLKCVEPRRKGGGNQHH